MAEGSAAGLALIEAIKDDPSLKDYHLLFGVRGDLLSRLERHSEAAAEFRREAATRNVRERDYMLERAEAAEQL